jgi:hypothetical protein
MQPRMEAEQGGQTWKPNMAADQEPAE